MFLRSSLRCAGGFVVVVVCVGALPGTVGIRAPAKCSGGMPRARDKSLTEAHEDRSELVFHALFGLLLAGKWRWCELNTLVMSLLVFPVQPAFVWCALHHFFCCFQFPPEG